MKAIYWRLYIIRLALRWIPKFNLGDRVIFRGREWTLHQGVRAPHWALVSGDESVDAYEYSFRKVRSLSNYWHSFRSAYRFYRVNWLEIWKEEGIQPWMLSCNIWAGKPPALRERSKNNG